MVYQPFVVASVILSVSIEAPDGSAVMVEVKDGPVVEPFVDEDVVNSELVVMVLATTADDAAARAMLEVFVIAEDV